jgi:integrase
MGIYRRARVWHMTFFYQGKRYRKSTETTDKKLAQRIYDKLKNEIAEGKWFEKLPGEYKSFNDMMDKYEVEHVSQKASARQYKGYIKNLRPFFGETLICQVTPSMINEYKIKRRNDGVGPASINRELAMVKNAFNKAVKEWGWVRDNPVTRIPMEKEPPGRVRYLTDEEFEKLLEGCPEWLRPIVLTARHTGLRKENILSLKWHQVDLNRRVITVERTKNGERLGIPINDTLWALFKRLSKVRYIRTEHVFYHPDAKKKTAKGRFNGRRYYEVKTAFQKALEEAGIGNFRFHDLRHCFASALVQRGADLYEVQRLLGHKSHAMTQRYAHLAPENLRNAVLKLDKTDAEKDTATSKSQSQGRAGNQAG